MSPSPERAPRQRGLVIVNKAERLILDLGPHIDKIPKHQRYRYALRLEGELWELVRRLIEAAMSNQKARSTEPMSRFGTFMLCCAMQQSASCWASSE